MLEDAERLDVRPTRSFYGKVPGSGSVRFSLLASPVSRHYGRIIYVTLSFLIEICPRRNLPNFTLMPRNTHANFVPTLRAWGAWVSFPYLMDPPMIVIGILSWSRGHRSLQICSDQRSPKCFAPNRSRSRGRQK